MFDTPVLFLVFNRPEHTSRSFEAIRAMRPTKLYVAGDGPRPHVLSDAEACSATRRLVEQRLDWPCTVRYLWRNENIGCGQAVSSAISWFFEWEEMGIILEDDCLASPAFFEFSARMLQVYQQHDLVMHINGSYLLPESEAGNHPPYLTLYAGIWGWATWRRAWSHYQFMLTHQKVNQALSFLESQKAEILAINYWKEMLTKMVDGEIDTWDYQWHATIWAQKALAISPGKNLVSNIGFGAEGTHTTEPVSVLANQPPWNGDLVELIQTVPQHLPGLDRALERWSLGVKDKTTQHPQLTHQGLGRARKLIRQLREFFATQFTF